MKTIKTVSVVSLMTLMASAVTAQTEFNFTGNQQTYQVPVGITEIQVEAWGAQGGDSEACDAGINLEDGGLGGFVSGNLDVTPGQTLNVYVGGKPAQVDGLGSPGGFNGGGISGQYGGAGGGASDIRIGGTALADRVIVAGAGGGGNNGCPDHGSGGAGGGFTADDGTSLRGFDPGLGGSQVAGGAGSGPSGFGTGIGEDGALGTGGGVTGDPYHFAGGGGGYYGGGAAEAAGAGGGSSYIDGFNTAPVTIDTGVRTGNGLIRITEVLSNEIGSISAGTAVYEYATPFASSSDGQSTNFRVDGTDVLFRDWWFFRVAGDSQETLLPAPDQTIYAGDTATLRWFDVDARGQFSAELTQVIAQPVAGSASLIHTFTINNLTDNALQIDLFKYADFDIGTAANDEGYLIAGNNYIGLIDNLTASSINTAEFRAAGNLAYQVLAWSSATPPPLRTQLSDAAITVLDDTGLPFGPGDFTGAFQWSQIIPGNGTYITEHSMAAGATTAPEPAPVQIYVDLIFKDDFDTQLP